MVLERQRQTTADLRALYALPENADKTFELLDGEIYEVDTPKPSHNFIGGGFYGFLFIYFQANPIGYVFYDNTGYEMFATDELIPDVSVILRARFPEPVFPNKFKFAPEIALEIVSPSNKPRDILKKVQTYLKYSTRLLWVVYPDERLVDVYMPAGGEKLTLYTVKADGVLTGGNVLPGFTLGLKNVFPPEYRLAAPDA